MNEEKKKGETTERPFWCTSLATPCLPDFAMHWFNVHWFQLLMEYPTVLKSFVGCYLSLIQATIQGRIDEKKITFPLWTEYYLID